MDEEHKSVNYLAFESTVSMMERTIRRLWITTIIMICLLVGTNVAWLIYESQFEYFTETTTIEQDAETDGDGNIILNGTGEVKYGKR